MSSSWYLLWYFKCNKLCYTSSSLQNTKTDQKQKERSSYYQKPIGNFSNLHLEIFIFFISLRFFRWKFLYSLLVHIPFIGDQIIYVWFWKYVFHPIHSIEKTAVIPLQHPKIRKYDQLKFLQVLLGLKEVLLEPQKLCPDWNNKKKKKWNR